MAEIFGGGEGVLAGLDANRMMGEIAQQPAELQIKQAQAQQAQMQVQQKQRFMQMMQDAKLGQSGTPGGGEDYEKMANIAMQSGNPDEALKIMQGAYLMRQRGAKANLALTDELVKRGKATQQTLDLGARLFAGVHDTESQRAAARVWKQMAPDAGPLADMMEQQEYSPELIDQAQKWGIAMKDQAGLAIKDAKEKSDEANRKSLDDYRKAKLVIDKQKADEDKRRKDAAAKAGGKPVTAPLEREQEAARRIIKLEFPDIDPETLKNAGYAAASMAKQAVSDNRGLDPDQALRRAIEKQKKDGDYSMVHTAGFNIPLYGATGGSDQTKFTRSDTPTTPKGDAKKDDAKLSTAERDWLDRAIKANPNAKEQELIDYGRSINKIR